MIEEQNMNYNQQKAVEELIADYNDFGDEPLGNHFWEVCNKYMVLQAEQKQIREILRNKGFKDC